jgi:hypothetical protein
VTTPEAQDPGVDPATGQLSPVVLDRLAVQLAPHITPHVTTTQQQTAAAERVQEEQEKAHNPRGCVDCGASLSWLAPGKGGWHSGRCHVCWLERGGDAGAGTDDGDARARACDLVLGTIAPPGWANAVPGVPTVAGRWDVQYKADAFRWFSEVPDARPAPGAQRFAYVTAEQLRDRLYQGRQPPPLVLRSRGKRHRCPACGCRGECWTVTQVAVAAGTTTTGEPSSARKAGFEVTWTCQGKGGSCRHVEVEWHPTQLPGIAVAGLRGG